MVIKFLTDVSFNKTYDKKNKATNPKKIIYPKGTILKNVHESFKETLLKYPKNVEIIE